MLVTVRVQNQQIVISKINKNYINDQLTITHQEATSNGSVKQHFGVSQPVRAPLRLWGDACLSELQARPLWSQPGLCRVSPQT